MNKIFKTLTLKALGTGHVVSDEQLVKINQYTLKDVSADDVYVRSFLIAHNFLDRDNERFNEELLDDFAKTLHGKGFFVEGHPSSWSGKGGPGEGLFFDVSTENMSPEEFKSLTGEEPNLPEGIETVKVLSGWAYVLKLESNSDTLKKIDAGIYRYISVGFNAPRTIVIDAKGNEMYGEYQVHGEALEASLCWLGAQPGASAMKACTNCKNKNHKKEEGEKMDIDILKLLGEKLGKELTEDNAIKMVTDLLAEKDQTIKELKAHAADGKAYRTHLVDEVIRFGTMIDDVTSEPDKQKEYFDFITTWPIEQLKMQKDKYEVSARKQFPDTFTFEPKDENSRIEQEEKAKAKKPSKGKKDYTNPCNNELINTSWE